MFLVSVNAPVETESDRLKITFHKSCFLPNVFNAKEFRLILLKVLFFYSELFSRLNGREFIASHTFKHVDQTDI